MTDQLLPISEVCRRTGLGRSSIYRMMDAGRFPRPVQLSARRVAWPEEEIRRWIGNQVLKRDLGLSHDAK